MFGRYTLLLLVLVSAFRPLSARGEFCLALLSPVEKATFTSGTRVTEVQTLTIEGSNSNVDLGKIFYSMEEETLIGVSNDGHFYMVHSGYRVDAKPFRELQVRKTSSIQRGAILRFTDLSPAQRTRLDEAVAKLKSKRVASCSAGVCNVLSEAGVDLPGIGSMSRIFTAGTFQKLVSGALKDFQGNPLKIEIYQTAPQVLSSLNLQLRTQDIMRPISYLGIVVFITIVADQMGWITLPVLF